MGIGGYWWSTENCTYVLVSNECVPTSRYSTYGLTDTKRGLSVLMPKCVLSTRYCTGDQPMQLVHVSDQPTCTKTYSFLFVLLALPHPLMLGYGTSGLTVLRDKTSVAYLPSCHLFTLLPIRITVERS